jgi:hypothetical protein
VGGILRDPRIINTAAQLLLQLPFSRRAEAEADLIGLKLMALAGEGWWGGVVGGWGGRDESGTDFVVLRGRCLADMCNQRAPMGSEGGNRSTIRLLVAGLEWYCDAGLVIA